MFKGQNLLVWWWWFSLYAMPTLVTPWTVARQAPLSTGFPRQEYWSGLPFPTPGDLPDPGIELVSPVSAGGLFTTEPLVQFSCPVVSRVPVTP